MSKKKRDLPANPNLILSQFIIKQIDDIKTIASLIKQCGHFSRNQYKKLKNQIQSSHYTYSLKAHLKAQLQISIWPLVIEFEKRDKQIRDQNEINKINELIKNREDAKIESAKLHLASEFKFHKGYIQCGKFKLQSVRIPKVPDSAIQSITRTFKIKATSDLNFIFDPPQDLSVFLKLVGGENAGHAGITSYSVTVSEFIYVRSNNGNISKLSYNGCTCEFDGKSEWCKREALSLVNERFVVFCENNNKLRFQNINDPQRLKSLLSSAYIKWEKSKRKEAKHLIFQEIEKRINLEIEKKITSFNLFRISVPFSQFNLNSESLVYETKVDALDYLDMSETGRSLHLSVEDLIGFSTSKYTDDYKAEIRKRWPNGFKYIVTEAEIQNQCNHHYLYDYLRTDTAVSCKVPAIIIEKECYPKTLNFLVSSFSVQFPNIVSYDIAYKSFVIPIEKTISIQRNTNRNQIESVCFENLTKESLKKSYAKLIVIMARYSILHISVCSMRLILI